MNAHLTLEGRIMNPELVQFLAVVGAVSISIMFGWWVYLLLGLFFDWKHSRKARRA